ncbi:GNAT family N-acetyltransferase [Rhodobacterales bacterium HKCCE3408]|nr:GNAT family N-acetyltransferase [Rhodobacterales bacterium HKCCE3408]
MGPRPATERDLPAIASLHAANWRAAYAGLVPDAALGAPLEDYMARTWTVDRLVRDRVTVIGEGELLGFAAADPDHRDGPYLDNLHVAAEARGQGLSRRLVADLAATLGDRALWLVVLAGNAPTRAVYRAWGGIEGPVFDDEILGVTVPALPVTFPDARALADRLGGGPGAI